METKLLTSSPWTLGTSFETARLEIFFTSVLRVEFLDSLSKWVLFESVASASISVGKFLGSNGRIKSEKENGKIKFKIYKIEFIILLPSRRPTISFAGH